MSSIVVEKKINTDNFQGKVVYPKKRLNFNDWINKIYNNIEKANDIVNISLHFLLKDV